MPHIEMQPSNSFNQSLTLSRWDMANVPSVDRFELRNELAIYTQ